jgi:hypothetical protein
LVEDGCDRRGRDQSGPALSVSVEGHAYRSRIYKLNLRALESARTLAGVKCQQQDQEKQQFHIQSPSTARTLNESVRKWNAFSMAKRTHPTQQPKAADPYNIPETVCDGPFNVQFGGNRATLTFTHLRAKAGPLLDQSTTDFEVIVRARIVFSMDNLVALKNSLNQMLPDPPPAEGAAATVGAKPH